jgi:RimJ/RimL family protein N-acetyltransferase
MSLPFAIPVLETERLTLRGPRESDIPALIDFGKSPRSRFMGGTYDAYGAWRSVMAAVGHWALRGYGYWSVDRREDGVFLGRVGPILNPGDTVPELAWHLFDGFEGHGYMTEAARAARAHGREALGVAALVSFIDPVNLRSVALAQRLAAVPVGEVTDDGRVYQVWQHPETEVVP